MTAANAAQLNFTAALV